MSKTHFYGRAAAEAVLVTVLSALLRARSARRGFRYYKATYRSFMEKYRLFLAEKKRSFFINDRKVGIFTKKFFFTFGISVSSHLQRLLERRQEALILYTLSAQ